MIRIIEVGPRDGLQNEKVPISTELKAAFIKNLVQAGLKEIEVSSFVSPKWVPQLGDAAELFSLVRDIEGLIPSFLVPNEKGLDRALEIGVERIALFTAASDAFTKRNINMSVDESLEVFAEVIKRFRRTQPNGWVRGYVSTIVVCPFAGEISPSTVGDVTKKLFDLGVDEVSLGDTIGVAVPKDIHLVADEIERICDKSKIAWHFHDTHGTAIANAAAMIKRGYQAFDSSAAGLGGCPYAKSATGNASTEDLVYLCERTGLDTGVNLPALAEASLPVLEALGRPVSSKTQMALLAQP